MPSRSMHVVKMAGFPLHTVLYFKILTFAISCHDSQDYCSTCIHCLLSLRVEDALLPCLILTWAMWLALAGGVFWKCNICFHNFALFLYFWHDHDALVAADPQPDPKIWPMEQVCPSPCPRAKPSWVWLRSAKFQLPGMRKVSICWYKTLRGCN